MLIIVHLTVKLHDRGLEAIEVSDNGHGVPPSSRPYMAMKHATSKLRHFDDLYNEEDCAPTLGFRGEALFCLANISRSLTVSTRSAEDNNDSTNNESTNKSKLGEQFEFDSNGHILPATIKRIPLSQLTGTTVTVRGLFESLPVRRVDMYKRIKIQRMKLMKMMQGYAILCLGTQFNLADINGPSNNISNSSKSNSNRTTSKQKIEVRLATSESSKTLDSRVASVLGTKFLSGLTRIDVDLSKAVQLSSSSANDKQHTIPDGGSTTRWKVQGLISHSPASPHSANARELQFFGINGRPVDLPSVSRLLGDVWRMFDPISAEGETNTGRRRPACILAFTLPNSMYDVNLSPDKREVMFTEEAAMSELIREGLVELWSSQSEGKFEANEVESRSNKNVKVKCGHDRVGTNQREACNDTNVELMQRNENEIEGVTPKLSRRSIENGPIVTPLDSEDPIQNDLITSPSQLQVNGSDTAYNDTMNDRGHLQSISPPDIDTEPKENDNYKRKRGVQINGAEMQQPERARTQDRRSWNQAQINFQRIQKTEARLEVDRILSPNDSDEGQRDINNRPSNDTVLKQSLSKQATIKSSLDVDGVTMDGSMTHRPSKRMKRQTKQNVTSFLDSFAYGSAKPVVDDCGSEDNKESDDSGQLEENSVVDIVDSRRIDQRKETVKIFRMVEGRTLTAKMSPQSTRRNDRTMNMKDKQSDHRGDSILRKCNNPRKSPSVDVVWNSFCGTQNVIAQSRHARWMMRKTRKYILSSLKRDRDDSRYQDATGTIASDAVSSGKENTVNLCKEDFLHMSIIGQFNLGFILARCRNHNLWILDQHACDEKYNFERLCKETVIHEQTLIAPLPLDLSPSEEHCVLEHMDEFERNGFRFSYDPEKEPRSRHYPTTDQVEMAGRLSSLKRKTWVHCVQC